VELYLIRHGIAQVATDEIEDDARSLTKEGRRKTEKVAKRLLGLGLHFETIATSPLVRARQTAEILKATGLSSQIEECAELGFAGDISHWLENWLEPRKYAPNTPIALVGHEPCLSTWAEILIWGEARTALVLKKAGMIGIKLPETGSPLGRSQMFWLTPPKYLL
jgi:phosphohistidine phosphatase